MVGPIVKTTDKRKQGKKQLQPSCEMDLDGCAVVGIGHRFQMIQGVIYKARGAGRVGQSHPVAQAVITVGDVDVWSRDEVQTAERVVATANGGAVGKGLVRAVTCGIVSVRGRVVERVSLRQQRGAILITSNRAPAGGAI